MNEAARPRVTTMNPINGVRALLHRIGFALRESGQALERTGCRLQGIYSYEEKRK